MTYVRPRRRPKPPRQPKPGRLLWTVRRGAAIQSAELQDSESFGIELQLFHNADLVYARRHESEMAAIEEAAAFRRKLQAEGWREQDGTDDSPPEP